MSEHTVFVPNYPHSFSLIKQLNVPYFSIYFHFCLEWPHILFLGGCPILINRQYLEHIFVFGQF